MTVASSHQSPHYHRWCLPLWLSSRLTLSLIWVSLFSPSLKPSRGRASASTHTYRRWRCLSSASQPLVAAGPALLFFIFFLSFLFFFNFYLPFRQDRTPLTLILFHFFISLMNNILFQFWLAWWMGFLVWISGISNNCYYWHFFGWALKMFVEMLHSVLVYLSVFCLFFNFLIFFFYFYAKTVMLCVWKLNFFLISLINGFSCWV